MSADETFHPQNQQLENFHRLKDLNSETVSIIPQQRTYFNSKQSLDTLLQSVASQPVLEQQLRFLSHRLGYDAKNLPDQQTLEALQSFIGTKLISAAANSSPSTSLLPASVASAASRSNFNITQIPLENKFLKKFYNDFSEMSSLSSKEMTKPILLTDLKPIYPINNIEHVSLFLTRSSSSLIIVLNNFLFSKKCFVKMQKN